MALKRKTTTKKAKTKPRTQKRVDKDSKANVAEVRKAHFKTYRELKKKIELAFGRLRRDVEKKAPTSRIVKDRNELLLLLGECNYLTNEYLRYLEE